MKRIYMKPETEIVNSSYGDSLMEISGGNPNSDQGDDGGVGARDFGFSEDENQDNNPFLRYNPWN